LSDFLSPQEREQRVREGLVELLELLRRFREERGKLLEPDHPFLRLVETFSRFLETALASDLTLPRRARGAVGNALDQLGALATGEVETEDAVERLEAARRILAEWVVDA